MKQNGKIVFVAGVALIVVFLIWTALVLLVDVQPLGQNGTNIGFATWNTWFHESVRLPPWSLHETMCGTNYPKDR